MFLKPQHKLWTFSIEEYFCSYLSNNKQPPCIILGISVTNKERTALCHINKRKLGQGILHEALKIKVGKQFIDLPSELTPK